MTAANTKYPMLVNSKENRELFYNDDCDKYDYLTAVACGASGGVVDIFLVGAPGDSVLGNWTDAQTDKAVITFAKKMGWKPKTGNEVTPTAQSVFWKETSRLTTIRESPEMSEIFSTLRPEHIT